MAKPAYYSSTHSTPKKKRLNKFWGRTICVDDFMTARVNHYIAGKARLKFSTLERTLSAVLYVHGNLSEFLSCLSNQIKFGKKYQIFAQFYLAPK